jgi:hypothetical protein
MGLRGVGPLAAVLLASQPLWLANARRAGLDVPALTLGLASVVGMGMAVRRGQIAWWAVAGALIGLAVGVKYVGLLAVVGAVGFWSWRWRTVVGALVAGVVAVVTFVGTNPALYGDPWGQLNVSLGFLAYQAEGMRHTIPEFGSALWVAWEMLDRMVWPIGGPRVVERSMLEPLIPGTYGTPVVTLGAAIAMVSLPWASRGRNEQLAAGVRVEGWRGIAAVVLWTVAVYAALAVSLPTWWERWHLPLVVPLALLGACGLAALPRGRLAVPVGRLAVPVGWALAGGQSVGAVALLPSYLNKGFGQLVMTPVGAVAHLGALAYALATLVSLALISARESRRGTGERGRTWLPAKTTSAV